jgi:hypothetical protein
VTTDQTKLFITFNNSDAAKWELILVSKIAALEWKRKIEIALQNLN